MKRGNRWCDRTQRYGRLVPLIQVRNPTKCPIGFSKISLSLRCHFSYNSNSFPQPYTASTRPTPTASVSATGLSNFTTDHLVQWWAKYGLPSNVKSQTRECWVRTRARTPQWRQNAVSNGFWKPLGWTAIAPPQSTSVACSEDQWKVPAPVISAHIYNKCARAHTHRTSTGLRFATLSVDFRAFPPF